MRCGSGRVGGGGNRKKPSPPPAGVHPRYVPKRGAVLKEIIRGMLRYFFLIPPVMVGPVNSGGSRVRPAPPGAGGDGAQRCWDSSDFTVTIGSRRSTHLPGPSDVRQ